MARVVRVGVDVGWLAGWWVGAASSGLARHFPFHSIWTTT